MAGALVLNPSSPHYVDLKQYQNLRYEDLLYEEDAVVLERNSRDFKQRMSRINHTTRALVHWLQRQPQVERLYTPYSHTATWGDVLVQPSLSEGAGGAVSDGVNGDAGADAGVGVGVSASGSGSVSAVHHPCLKAGSSPGFGGLFSIVLRHAAATSAPFYDAVRISKGPSLGNNFSLLCPYTLLAHYAELDWAESVGIHRFLLRFSIGLEDELDLQHRLTQALQHIQPIIAQLDQAAEATSAPPSPPLPPPSSSTPPLASLTSAPPASQPPTQSLHQQQ